VCFGRTPCENGVGFLGDIFDLHARHGATMAPLAPICKSERACGRVCPAPGRSLPIGATADAPSDERSTKPPKKIEPWTCRLRMALCALSLQDFQRLELKNAAEHGTKRTPDAPTSALALLVKLNANRSRWRSAG